MVKNALFIAVLAIVASQTTTAATLVVSASRQLSSSVIADAYAAPGGFFKLTFSVDSNAIPLNGTVTSLGFDVPSQAFSYTLNGNLLNVTPSEIRFNTTSNGGLFDITIGSGLNGSDFDFQGVQAFSGTTAAPSFSTGTYAISSWTYSDAANYDLHTGVSAAATISPAPEPSTVVLFSAALLFVFGFCKRRRVNVNSLLLVAFLAVGGVSVQAQVPISQVMNIPNTGQQITPLAPRGARFTYLNPGLAAYPNQVVGQAVTAVTSPDHKTLLVLTTGDYGIYTPSGSADSAASTDWVFVFDITNPVPVQKQALQVANTYNGIVFDPNGAAFYVAGGRNDNVHIYTLTGGLWAEQAGSPIALGHSSQAGGVPPEAAGIAITADGTKLVVTSYENDSISVLTKSSGVWSKTADLDLRPGIIDPTKSGTPGGAYPFWVTIQGNNTAFVSSIRDREIDVVNIASATPTLTNRIKLKGQPLKSVLDSAQTTLYVAEDQTDSVAVINIAAGAVIAEVSVAAPLGVIPASRTSLSGNNTNSVTLSPDGATLYLTNGNTNNIAVVSVAMLTGGNPVLGLIPTGMYPNSVALSGSGAFMYVVNGKSPTGPNANHCHGGGSILPNLTGSGCNASNQYTLQMIKAGLQFIPTPPANQLNALTNQVALNNSYQAVESVSTTATMNFLAANIKHIIYIIKENRTYDQVLGDLPIGNGDPALTEFPASVTPNLHNLAQNFVALDHFYDVSEVSYDGWAWSTGAIAPDIVLRQTPVNYSFRRGLAYESEGDNRGINLVSPYGHERKQSRRASGPHGYCRSRWAG
jgi:sugar lactone lactonase YvrE